MRASFKAILVVLLFAFRLSAQASEASQFPLARGPLHCKGDLQVKAVNEKNEKLVTGTGAAEVDPTKFQKIEILKDTKVVALVYPLYGLHSEKIDKTTSIETDEENYVRVLVMEGSKKRSLECLF